jgi:hypothetical protein
VHHHLDLSVSVAGQPVSHDLIPIASLLIVRGWSLLDIAARLCHPRIEGSQHA